MSVRTIADVDGEVTVFLGDGELEGEGTVRVFSGTIAAPSGTIAVVTSENDKLLERSVRGDTAFVDVFVDDEEHPARVWGRAR